MKQKHTKYTQINTNKIKYTEDSEKSSKEVNLLQLCYEIEQTEQL